MKESMATYLKRHAPRPARDSRPRYLDRGFESVTDEAQASFVETVRENRIDIRLEERDLGKRLEFYHSKRALLNEERFRPRRPDEDFFQVGGILFRPGEPGRLKGSLPNGTQIVVGMHLFKKDAEAVLSILAAHGEALRQTGVVSITLGIEDVPEAKGKRLGICDTSDGTVIFFCDEHGGLLATGLAAVTKDDPKPCDAERAILHELAHMLDHNKTCMAHVTAIAQDITRFVRQDPKRIPAPWLAAAGAINAEYLPARFSAVLEGAAGSANPQQAHRMAHEFLAELVPAIVWQKKDIQFAPDCPASLKGLGTYIRRYGHAFSVVGKIKQLSTKTVPQGKNRILVHSDYLQYHGGGPEHWRSIISVGQSPVGHGGGR